VRRLRRKRRLTQQALEIRAGLPLGAISQIENCHLNPSKEALYRIASVLEVTLSEAFSLFGVDKLMRQQKMAKFVLQYKDKKRT
jgi:transcriptional regulator with XRE-family HTH domain